MTMPPRSTLLIVDDDRFVRVVLREALTGMNVRILEASDGEEALDVIAREQPSVVLLDLFMPRKSGLQVFADIRGQHPGTKIVIVSMMDSDPLVKQAIDAGAAGFIAKPFHPVEIISAVSRALGA
jgi:two-component system chemotaxis response regulator CheY